MDHSYGGLPQTSLSNPPPQVFGSYSADGSPTTGGYPAAYFADDGSYGYDDRGDDQGDPKRRRIAKVIKVEG